MTIVLLNFLISILNDSFTYIKDQGAGGNIPGVEPFDKSLNKHFWSKVSHMFSACSSKKSPSQPTDSNSKSLKSLICNSNMNAFVLRVMYTKFG